MSMINIRHLRAFVAVAEHQHFTNAADAIHVSQPALSALIKQLEDEMGVVLLHRNTRNVEITAIGREFYNIATKTLGSFDEALTHVKDYSALKKGRVTVAALPSLASSVMPAVVQKFLALHPRINVRILDLPGDEVIDAVRGKRADFGLTYTQPHSDLEAKVLMRDRLILIGKLQHASAKKGVVRWKSLGNEPIIAFARGTTIRALIDAAAASAKTSLNVVLEPKLIPTALAFAEHGLGSAILPSTITPGVSQYMKSCSQYELSGPAITRDISFIQLAGSQLSPAANGLLEQIEAFFTKEKLGVAMRRSAPAS